MYKNNNSDIVEKFGCRLIDDDIIKMFINKTGEEPYLWIDRKKIFAHRDLDLILQDYEDKRPIYLYTGIGPSSKSLHLGHLIPFVTTVWLHNILDIPVIIQIADDEKVYTGDMKYEDVRKNAYENIKDIVSMGFNPKKTFIFLNRDYTSNHTYMQTVFEIMNHTSVGDINNIFGTNDQSKLGNIMWPAFQTAPSYSRSFDFLPKDARCLIVCSVDQDPYTRFARDLAGKMGSKKPASIICDYLPSLSGISKGKMSSSDNHNYSIYLSDSDDIITSKIKKHAYSGGQETIEKHRLLGGNINIDISYQYLLFFEEDDSLLKDIAEGYKKGILLTSELKEMLIKKLKWIMRDIRKMREANGEKIDEYMISSNLS